MLAEGLGTLAETFHSVLAPSPLPLPALGRGEPKTVSFVEDEEFSSPYSAMLTEYSVSCIDQDSGCSRLFPRLAAVLNVGAAVLSGDCRGSGCLQAGSRQSREPSLTVGLLNRSETQVSSPRVSKGTASDSTPAGRRSEIGSHIQHFFDYVTLSLKSITWTISLCHPLIAGRQ